MTLLADLPLGLTGRAEMTVTDRDTAIALESGDVAVLGTPRLIALCEKATVDALGSLLPPSWTTVAMRVRIHHLAPVGVGGEVTVEAALDRVEGRRLIFTVTAADSAGLVAVGKVTHVAVERDRFLAKAH